MNAPTVYRIRTEILPRTCRQAVTVLVGAALLALAVNYSRPNGLPLVANWSPEARLKAATGEGMLIPLKAAVEFYDLQEAVFVDAQPEERFASGHIPGAINIPKSALDLNKNLFTGQVAASNNIVIIYGNYRACTSAAKLMRIIKEGFGYPNVRILENGFMQWVGAGYPIERTGGRAP